MEGRIFTAPSRQDWLLRQRQRGEKDPNKPVCNAAAGGLVVDPLTADAPPFQNDGSLLGVVSLLCFEER